MTEYRMQGPVGARTLINDRECDYFSGTGYLGLQNHPQVLAAAAQCLNRYGLSTATSRGGYGEHPVFDQLTREVCGFFGRDGLLSFPSGYMGMSVLAQGLKLDYDQIFVDDESHFSILDAARLSGKPVQLFRHLDAGALRECMYASIKARERALILSDGVFPISGEICPLPDYLKVLDEFAGVIALDDAHAVGVLGENGRGVLDFWKVNDERVWSSATLSKALGGYGGVICETKQRTAHVAAFTKVLSGASPISLPVAAASAQALRLARTQTQLRERLWENVRFMRAGLRNLGWTMVDSPVPILCLPWRDGLDLAIIQESLFQQNICVAHVSNYSSTPPGGAIRIAVFSTHSQPQMERLLEALAAFS